MPLIPFSLPEADIDLALTLAESAFLNVAMSHLASFRLDHPAMSTVLISDPLLFRRTLCQLQQTTILRGSTYCEWGSGLGIMSGLAALRGFDIYGFEIVPELVNAARQLFLTSGLKGHFISGSFIPTEFSSAFSISGTYGATVWGNSLDVNVYAEIGKCCCEMDVIFAYPWPREVLIYQRIFEYVAGEGALLWLYRHGQLPLLFIKAENLAALPF